MTFGDFRMLIGQFNAPFISELLNSFQTDFSSKMIGVDDDP